MKAHPSREMTPAQNLLMLIGSFETEFQFSDLDGLHRMVLFYILDAKFKGNNITINHILERKWSSRSSIYRKISDLKKGEFITEEWDGYICHLVPTPKIGHILQRIEKWLDQYHDEGQRHP